MPLSVRRAALLSALFLPLAACGEQAQVPVEQGYGANPTLPEPRSSWIPTIHIADAKGWPEDGKPVAAQGFAVEAFARGLDHPRTVYTLPNGDVLVTETDAPPKPEANKGIRGWIQSFMMKNAGSGTKPSANRIALLRDADGDGTPETRTVFLENLNSPFGMVLVGDQFYVANTDAVVRFPYQEGTTEIREAGTKLADLPGGPINHHWTKDLTASPDGTKLYATSGSNSNVGERGMEAETNRAAVLEIDVASGESRLFASGLRNPNGITFHPQTGDIWVAVNERDEIGSDLVPDYMTRVKDGGFYGWPYSWFGQNVDERVQPPNPDLVAKAIVPDYALGAHTASLGLAFYTGSLFPAEYANGAFVGQHGSWNRKPRSGYKVIFVPFENGLPSGQPRDILTGFVDEKNDEAFGRPVGVDIDRSGALLVADDVGGIVWRVTPSAQ
ncbi:PQQ-dependent sugar dehydrogenase [Terrihabitans sp. B22-R8]|uniref:PQQ-dependent sugar dehydrogenase n=1 Tax=Terrihabitans sp. B22-R8 TaxID=3425128 RepID=UPI00403CB271